jgi:multimeric flavodoxin WrbA
LGGVLIAMAMKVVGISGSPRKGGNTEALLGRALDPFRESGWIVKEHLLSSCTIAPCVACESCHATGVCAIDDDMRQIYEDFNDCDALIIGTPVYYRNVSAQLKAVFDRSYAVRSARPLAGRFGGAIAVGRGTGGGQCIALTVIHNFFLSMGVVCVPGELNGVSAMADRPGDVLRDEKRLLQARILGENILRLAEKARA